jgi:hypothetical protein
MLLYFLPSSRHYFRPSTFPDAALLAFFPPDALLFVTAALWAAYKLATKPSAGVIPLSLHTGAAVYGFLYCLTQSLRTGEAWLAVLFMTPPAMDGPLLLWKLNMQE